MAAQLVWSACGAAAGGFAAALSSVLLRKRKRESVAALAVVENVLTGDEDARPTHSLSARARHQGPEGPGAARGRKCMTRHGRIAGAEGARSRRRLRAAPPQAPPQRRSAARRPRVLIPRHPPLVLQPPPSAPWRTPP